LVQRGPTSQPTPQAPPPQRRPPQSRPAPPPSSNMVPGTEPPCSNPCSNPSDERRPMTTSPHGDARIHARRGAGVAYRIGLESRRHPPSRRDRHCSPVTTDDGAQDERSSA
jgi:hypothetical protein